MPSGVCARGQQIGSPVKAAYLCERESARPGAGTARKIPLRSYDPYGSGNALRPPRIADYSSRGFTDLGIEAIDFGVWAQIPGMDTPEKCFCGVLMH